MAKRKTPTAKTAPAASAKDNSDPRRLVIKGLTCGKCDHFERSPKFPDVCSKLGFKSFSTPCKYFAPSPLAVNFRQSGTGVHLARLMRNAKSTDLDVMAAFLVGEKLTRKHGFYFGQQVVVKIVQAGTHLNHYASASIVRADAKYAYVQGINGFRGQMLHDSVIDAEAFEPVRQALVKAGKTVCPKAEKLIGSSVMPPATGIRNFSTVRSVDPEVGAVEGQTMKAEYKEVTKARVVLIGGDTKKRDADLKAAKVKAKAKK
jgi:hypothetical protein